MGKIRSLSGTEKKFLEFKFSIQDHDLIRAFSWIANYQGCCIISHFEYLWVILQLKGYFIFSYDFKMKIEPIYVILKKWYFLRYRVWGDKKISSTKIHKNKKLNFYGQLIVLRVKKNNSYDSKHLICEI